MDWNIDGGEQGNGNNKDKSGYNTATNSQRNFSNFNYGNQGNQGNKNSFNADDSIFEDTNQQSNINRKYQDGVAKVKADKKAKISKLLKQI